MAGVAQVWLTDKEVRQALKCRREFLASNGRAQEIKTDPLVAKLRAALRPIACPIVPPAENPERHHDFDRSNE